MNQAAPAGLYYLGNYVRELPVSLGRMIENAYDWEHLPFVHPTSFASISLIDEGEWGWRCNTTLPPAAGGGEQIIELLVNRPDHSWITTVLEGLGAGIQIRTKATNRNAIDGRLIAVDVQFLVPQKPESSEHAAMVLGYLQAQYATLYDEDEALMSARQNALDARKITPDRLPSGLDLGPIADLDRAKPYPADLRQGRYTVRFHDGAWIAHSSVCPHLLGPLADARLVDGRIVCPWHGYAFALDSGAEELARCGALIAAPPLRERQGHLFIGD